MAIGRMTYLDIPIEDRKAAAKVARQKLQAMLANPFMAQEQVTFLQERLEAVDQWEMGLMSLNPNAEAEQLTGVPAPKQLEAIQDAEWESVDVDMKAD